MSKITTKQAMHHLKMLMKSDPDYAYGWHSNIAMMCYDSIMKEHEREQTEYDDESTKHSVALNIGDDAASRFMKLCFDVVTSQDMLIKDKDSE